MEVCFLGNTSLILLITILLSLVGGLPLIKYTNETSTLFNFTATLLWMEKQN